MVAASEPHRDLPAWRKLLRFAKIALRPRAARRLMTIATDGYLSETGWIASAATATMVDGAGQSIPWATLPFLGFLTPRLGCTWTVFEYGAGASTLYYAGRVAHVIAVEHDTAFAANLRARLPNNAELVVAPFDSADYVGAIARCEPRPQLVAVDGRERVACVQAAIPYLAADGVLVLDDAERAEYRAAHDALRQASFKIVEFWGIAPGEVRAKCTAVFYRTDNVLGL
jgi:hypothetical protein